jgi:hypothetical protein
MENRNADRSVLHHIGRLVEEEHRLLGHASLEAADSDRLTALQVELDQCWDLLRQRRALRETGGEPADAQVRPPEVVEKYIG